MIVDYIYDNEAAIRLYIFLSAFIILALLEWQWPKRALVQKKTRRWLNNISLIVTSTLIVRFIMPTAAVGAAYLAEQHHLGFFNHSDIPFWLQMVMVFIVLDLSVYLQHVFFHVMPIMWRFHRVHHSDLDFDVTTGVRFHPVEILLSIIIKIALILLWGAPVLAVILFEMVLNFMSMFTHSNIRLNEHFERVLRWFFVTPDMHRVHHSAKENETNSNFAFHISIWDRIFGTYKAAPEAGHQAMKIGLEQFRSDEYQQFKSLMLMPFYGGVRGYAINYRDTANERELAQAREISLQVQQKAKLATELDVYVRAINEHALVSVTDSDGNIIQVNNKFCEVSGYSRRELLGENHRIVNSETHDSEFFKEMWSTISGGKKWQGEVCNRGKNGQLYWVDSAIVPVIDENGKVERYVSVRIDITERKKYELGIENANRELTNANIQLEELSRVDGLTGIANRRCFDECLTNYISTMSRANTNLTLMLCDIDHFKNYNDRYGHQAGDECLQKVAKSIEQNFTRAGDVVARYGGEEFAVILPNVDKETAIMLAERICSNVALLEIEHAKSSVAERVTVSVGVVTVEPDKITSTTDVINKADKALYRAKNAGRNRVEVSS